MLFGDRKNLIEQKGSTRQLIVSCSKYSLELRRKLVITMNIDADQLDDYVEEDVIGSYAGHLETTLK